MMRCGNPGVCLHVVRGFLLAHMLSRLCRCPFFTRLGRTCVVPVCVLGPAQVGSEQCEPP